MSEEKTVSKPRQLWDSAVKAVKGGGTEQLIETFTAEMTLRENQKEIDRRLDELTRRMNTLEAKAAKQDGKLKREKNLISQLTLLAGIIAGAWVIVTVLNLFQ